MSCNMGFYGVALMRVRHSEEGFARRGNPPVINTVSVEKHYPSLWDCHGNRSCLAMTF